MGSKASSVLTTRVSMELKEQIDNLLKCEKMTRADVWADVCDMWERGAISTEGGHLREVIVEPEPIYEDRIHRNLRRFIEVLEEKGYPEGEIERVTEQIIDGARGIGRYNPRRSRVSDMGC